MYSETESSDGSVWSRGQGEAGDALRATSMITTIIAQDSDDDIDSIKVGEEEIVITDSWTSRFTNSFRNYMQPTTAVTPGGNLGNNKPSELESLQTLYESRCNECVQCQFTNTCKTAKVKLCPGCHSTPRTNASPCYHEQICDKYTEKQAQDYKVGLAYHIEYYKGRSEHPMYLEYQSDIRNNTTPNFSLPLPPIPTKNTLPAAANIESEAMITSASLGPGATALTTSASNTSGKNTHTTNVVVSASPSTGAGYVPFEQSNIQLQRNEALLRQLEEQRINHERDRKKL